MSKAKHNQKTEAERLNVSAQYLNSIINGAVDAGYNLAVLLSKEVGGTVELWKTEKNSVDRQEAWRNHLTHLERK